MSRTLDKVTLENAAKIYAGILLLPSTFSKASPEVAINGQEWVMQSLYNATFKDEFELLIPMFKDFLGPGALTEFEKDAAERFTPRDDVTFETLLADKLAITSDGNHIEGKIGTVQFGDRLIGTRIDELEMLDSIRRRRRLGLPKTAENRVLMQQVSAHYWPVYAGETEERAADSGVADPFPSGAETHLFTMALNTNVSIAFAIAALDPALDLLDEGTVDGYIDGRTGSQPVDPNAAITGTRLFANDLATPGFGGAVDDSPGALATAGAIADDVSADATGTVTYCRGSSADTIITLKNAHIDGSAGLTAGTFDFEFNTDAIVSGAVVSFTAWTVTQPQGPTAT